MSRFLTDLLPFHRKTVLTEFLHIGYTDRFIPLMNKLRNLHTKVLELSEKL